MGQPDPLIDALNATARRRGGQTFRIVQLFGDRPDVLDAIRAAHARGASPETIAGTLSTESETISAGAVQAWLRRRG